MAQNLSDINETLGIPEHRKVAYIATTSFQTLIASYTLLSLICYEYYRKKGGVYSNRGSIHRSRSGKHISSHTYSSDVSSAPNTHASSSKTKSKKSSHWLRLMCICSTILVIIRILLELIELAPINSTKIYCDVYIIPLVISYSLALASIYFILWYRLYIFLSHPAMKHLGSKAIKIIAYFVLFLIFGTSCLYTILYLSSTKSINGYGGCMLSVTDNLADKVRFIILTFSSVIAQGALLGLFIYPLLKHKATMHAFYNSNKTNNNNDNSRLRVNSPMLKSKGILSTGKQNLAKMKSSFTASVTRKRSRQIKRQVAIVVVIKRVMLTAIVCIISDIVTGIMATILRTQPRIVTNLMYDSNLLVNLICVVISFKDWTSRLTLNIYKPKDKKQSQSPHLRRLKIKNPSNNNVFDENLTPASVTSPGMFSQATTDTPILSAAGEQEPLKNRFIFDEKSVSTSTGEEA